MTTTNREASRLLYKALHVGLSPANDHEYRELLARYRADSAFALIVQETAIGLELTILDVSERGLIVAPSGRESRFSLRISQLRQQLTSEQKIALAISHLAICTVFFPTTSQVEDDSRAPLPATLARFRDTLVTLVTRLSEAKQPEVEGAEQLTPGWQLVKSLPSANPRSDRASISSVQGLIKLALKQMMDYGLIRMERESEDETQTVYTATHRLRVHLRELTLPRLFEITREKATT